MDLARLPGHLARRLVRTQAVGLSGGGAGGSRRRRLPAVLRDRIRHRPGVAVGLALDFDRTAVPVLGLIVFAMSSAVYASTGQEPG